MWAILLFAQASTPLSAQDHANCLTGAALKMEASGESAGDVAVAAVYACRSLEPKATESNVAGQMSAAALNDTMEKLRISFHARVLQFLIDYRACKRTKGCAPSSVAAIKPFAAVEYILSDAPKLK